ncbi:MAG: DUF1016 family protein [Paludibacteraceae bacterium]|nr:DUF1016 family protein [Paludibacteraceae bacterium]
MNTLTIIDKDYAEWLKNLKKRYRRCQIKAAVKVNQEVIRFYWELGHDIVEMHVEERWGESIIDKLAVDLKREIPGISGISRRNIYYCKQFYLLYYQQIEKMPQAVAQIDESQSYPTHLNDELKFVPQAVAQLDVKQERISFLLNSLFSVPWGHHRFIIDRCSTNPDKALFFVHQTVANGWSRSMLLNFLDTDLYERQGKAISNFSRTLPDETSDLAQEITKDPYDFAFTGITGRYNERLLKDKLLNNITNFLIELGTGFAYVGKEYRLEIGETENFIDLLFYNLKLRCYVAVEVKTGKFESRDIGQLGTYMVAVDHMLCSKYDNKTIGLLICKSKDTIMARYALESSAQPIGISEYELEKFYPEKIEGTIPTIEEIETKLTEIIKSNK